MLSQPPVSLRQASLGPASPLGPLPPGADTLAVTAGVVEAGGAAGAVLAIQATLQPPQLHRLVVQLGAEGLLPRALICHHRNRRRPDVQAHQPAADLVARQGPA